ncbi:hypothetical protein [Kiloniella litopenaei]|uniref:hypothetical protein n=1 Tax=Kiloniella litopenaei TaxID=1549748 RepID=UPI003BACC4AB
MPHKMIPHSVRLSEEDSDFIAKLRVPGAVSPSEKIRAIIKERRDRSQRGATYEGLLLSSEEILLPIIHRLKTKELDNKEHSELMSLFMEWLLEATSYIAFEMSEDKQNLVDVERGIMERLSRVMNGALRLGVTPNAPCYDPQIIRDHISDTLELTALIQSQLDKESLNA